MTKARAVVAHCLAVAAALVSTLGTRAHAAAQTMPPGDSAAVAWARHEVRRLMERLDVPGAVVVIVRHDALLLNAGLGLASVEGRVPVDSARTVFRIASVSKVFTALAALQLVERGKLALDENLLVRMPELTRGGETHDSITLHHLLTHTAGFDEQLIGYLNPAGVAPAPLGEYIPATMPRRTRPANDVPGYSNHGYGLVGLAVERASGERFEAYLRAHVFEPLGMTRTEVVLRPAADSSGVLASEYRSDGSRRIPRSSRPYPAGNVGTTGADAARFLQALLRASRGDEDSVISRRVAERLMGPVLRYHPAMPPMGYGMSADEIDGHLVWLKGGASPSHSALLAVIPDLDVGVFIAVNRQEPQVWDRFLPGLVKVLAPPSSARDAPKKERPADPRVGGTYLFTRAPLSSIERVVGLATQIRVSPRAGGVDISGGLELGGRWREEDSLVYRHEDGRRLAFRIGANGRASHVFSIMQGQPVSFERIAVFESTAAQLGGLLVAILLAVIGGVVAVWRNRPARRGAEPSWARHAMWMLPVAVLATVAVAVGLARQADLLQEGPTSLLTAALLLATATGLLALAQTAGALTLGTRGGVGPIARGTYLLSGAAGAMIFWFLLSNHLVRAPGM